MKPSKKLFIIVMLLVVSAASYWLTRPASPQAQVTAFVAQPPHVDLIASAASPEALEFTLQVKGMPEGIAFRDLGNWICQPQLRSRGAASLGNNASFGGGWQVLRVNGRTDFDPQATTRDETLELAYRYVWQLQQPGAQTFPVAIDVTIGPCYVSFAEGTTPVPGIELLGSYAFVLDLVLP